MFLLLLVILFIKTIYYLYHFLYHKLRVPYHLAYYVKGLDCHFILIKVGEYAIYSFLP